MPPHSYDYTTQTISPDVAEQTEQCMRNVSAALREAGGCVGDVVRVRYILPRRDDFPSTWPVLKRWFVEGKGEGEGEGGQGGGARPAATMMVAGLMEEAMKIEIEVTARTRKTKTTTTSTKTTEE